MKLKSLRQIIGIASIVSCLTCGGAKAVKKQYDIYLPGAVKKSATYVIETYDNNKNGLCDKYKILGPGMSGAEIGLKTSEELPATEIQFEIESQKGLVDHIEFY